MGKKFIITESQERILTRLFERELGPEESVFVTNKNPFKHSEWSKAAKPYNPNLLDGDYFFVFDEASYEVNKLYEFDKNVDGKTLRVDDEIIRIESQPALFNTILKSKYMGEAIHKYANLLVQGYITYKLGDLPVGIVVGRTNDGWKPIVYYDSKKPHIICGDDGFIPKNPEEKTKVENFCTLLSPIITHIENQIKVMNQSKSLNQIPDQYFEIRQIKRKKTDF